MRKKIYDEMLKGELEPGHKGCYVAVEAVGAAHDALPKAISILARFGYDGVHSIGGYGFHRG
jgi:hypothetical protein